MLKRLAVLCLLAFVPPALAACSSAGTSQSAPDSARRQLLVAEYAFEAALKIIDLEVSAGRLKGEKARAVAAALVAAKGALDAARVSVAGGKFDAAAVERVTLAVANVVSLYQAK